MFHVCLIVSTSVTVLADANSEEKTVRKYHRPMLDYCIAMSGYLRLSKEPAFAQSLLNKFDAKAPK